jgi:hypothetical protein
MFDRLVHILRARPFAVAALIVVFGAIFINLVHVSHFTELSPVDELQHIDYLYRAPAIVHTGDLVGQDAMREEACRILPQWPSPPCSNTAVYSASDFQETGVNTASQYTPLYYTLTKVLATPLTWVLGKDSLVTAARVVGGWYLAAGLFITFLIARRFGARPYLTAAVLLAAAATPDVLLPSATITPDSLALLSGASLVWSVLWWEESPRRRMWLPILLGVLTVLFKAISVIAVLLVVLFIVLRYVHGRLWPSHVEPDGTEPPRPGLIPSAVLAALVSMLSLAGSVGYVLYVGAIGTVPAESIPMTARALVPGFPSVGFVSHLGAFLQVFYWPGGYATTKHIGPFVQNVVGLLVFAGTFAAAFLINRARSATRLLSVSLLIVGLVGAPLIIAMTYFSVHTYVPIPGRYALTLVPAGLATAVSTVKRKPAQWFVGVSGAVLYLAVLAWMFIVPM